jgi:polyisoprenoid-binding protein YceI
MSIPYIHRSNVFKRQLLRIVRETQASRVIMTGLTSSCKGIYLEVEIQALSRKLVSVWLTGTYRRIMKKPFLLGAFAALAFTYVAEAEVRDLKVDLNESYVGWTGRKVAGQHNGKVLLKEGTIKVDDGAVVGGKFVVNMDSIANEDIKSDEWRHKLESHLKSDDFFNVAGFPDSSFEITEVKLIEDGKQLLEGKLTVKGISLPVSIPVEIKKEGDKYIGIGKVTLDRIKWDIRYNSGKFFDPKTLGDKLIYDDINIDVKVVASGV